MSAPSQRFFFVHLQKTGGTALFRRLRHHFGPEAVYPLPEEQGTPESVLDVDRLLRRLDELGEQVEVVTGHFPLCVTELLPGPFETLTILREPVERTLSFLRHQRKVEPRFAGWSLEAIYSDPVSAGGFVSNHMTRMLSMTSDEMTDGVLTPVTVDEARLGSACRNLAERVHVVGVQEHFEEFCQALESTYGWDLGKPVFMNRTGPSDASPELRQRIRVDNQHDDQLYELALDLWHRRHGRST